MAPSAEAKVAIDLAAGTIAGTAQLLVGHPFDTIKVKIQSQSNTPGSAAYKGPIDATKQTLLKEGIRGIYKGMGAPLATVALFNAVLFAARGQMQLLLAHADGSALSLAEQMLVAVGASCAVSVVATPTELLKCRLQAQGEYETAVQRFKAAGIDPSTQKIYRGPIDVAKHVLAAEAGVRGLFKGMAATLGREVPGNIAMFGVYELLKVQFARRQGLRSTSELGQGSLLLAGGCAGTCFWLACYPMDIIKSNLQVDSFRSPKYRGILDCGRQIVAAEGISGLWRGFGPALARSFPANAACFAVYEASQQLMCRALELRT